MSTGDSSTGIPEARGAVLRGSIREIFVVSLSILIAFWIDASWDARQERVETERVLSSVVEELRLNASVLERGSGQFGARAQAGLGLLNLTGPEADSAAAVSALNLVPAFWQTPSAELSTIALSTALESGAMSAVSDLELRETLSSLPRAYSRLDGGRLAAAEVMREHLFPLLWMHVPQMDIEMEAGMGNADLRAEFRAAVPARSRFSADVGGLLRDLAFENAVVERTSLLMIARSRSAILADELRRYAAALEAWNSR
jgi:hypothetical protein